MKENKPKSTTIELTNGMLNAIVAVDGNEAQRIASPIKHKVYRVGGKIYLEVFHNDV